MSETHPPCTKNFQVSKNIPRLTNPHEYCMSHRIPHTIFSACSQIYAVSYTNHVATLHPTAKCVSYSDNPPQTLTFSQSRKKLLMFAEHVHPKNIFLLLLCEPQFPRIYDKNRLQPNNESPLLGHPHRPARQGAPFFHALRYQQSDPISTQQFPAPSPYIQRASSDCQKIVCHQGSLYAETHRYHKHPDIAAPHAAGPIL